MIVPFVVVIACCCCCCCCQVCCKCCDLLERQSSKPLLKVHSLNPQLYTYVQDLVKIEVSVAMVTQS